MTETVSTVDINTHSNQRIDVQHLEQSASHVENTTTGRHYVCLTNKRRTSLVIGHHHVNVVGQTTDHKEEHARKLPNVTQAVIT